MVPSASSLTPTSGGGSGAGGGSSSSSSGTHQSPVLLIAALLAVVAGVMYALLRQHPAGGGAGGVGYEPANTTSGGSSSAGWWEWLGSAGGFGARHAGAGFELTDLQGRNRELQQGGRTHRGDGLDEFFVGGGRRGKGAESGPGYASLLAGQEQ